MCICTVKIKCPFSLGSLTIVISEREQIGKVDRFLCTAKFLIE